MTALFIVGLSLSACGSGAPPKPVTTTTQKLTGFAAQSPTAIFAAGCGATLPARSVLVTSRFSSPSLNGGLESMQWTMTSAADQGMLHFKNGNNVDLVVVSNLTYVKAPAVWWKTTTAASSAAVLANRWIAISASSASAPIVAPFLASSNLQSVLAPCLTSPALAKGPLGSVGSQQTIDVLLASGNPVTTQQFSIPTMEIPYIVKIVTSTPQTGSQISLLTGFNLQRAVIVPTGAVAIESAGSSAS